mmetsp:Transcript_6183/g.9463  ORF Transcript_6183/g.9463 Transcript_6183/m.9463 type:complete len:273 (-) Transcript_6183:489-1307(-)|eukprot:CAMPEP_0195289076 /NCGR_PEP_ID=MMETSP0707-20130614/5506_1 /TAXON_ID=33640 /ORGANISM="Asterionellopsis glacialis, Strain CCMP134" /LENGTH=272 /DNA_ID=CAMNT_0040349039 /DNA_START=59 /DNA_END=877 /DNA_ORIENTATION=-
MTTRDSVPVVVPPSHSNYPPTSGSRVTPGTEAAVSNLKSNATSSSSDSQTLLAPSSSVLSSSQDHLDPTALKIRKSWRQVVSSAVITFRTADKFRAKLAAVQQQHPSLDTSPMLFSKEVDEGIVTSLRARADFRKNLTVLEGKVSGQAQEAEALESCRRTQSRLGGGGQGRRRKRRKRPHVPSPKEKEDEGTTAAAITTHPPTTSAVPTPATPPVTLPTTVHSTGATTAVPPQPQAPSMTPARTTDPGGVSQPPPPTLPPQVQNPSYSLPPF